MHADRLYHGRTRGLSSPRRQESYRCMHHQLSRIRWGHYHQRDVDFRRETAPYKCSGNESSSVSSPKPRDESSPLSPGVHRQHLCGGLHQSPGETRSRTLLKETVMLFQHLQKWNMSLQAVHISGHLNVITDMLSREGQILSTEWSLNQAVVDVLF